ncbi:SGNH/GDSL hydrolase family protein [Actinomadura terrae]|uniref:SGNH/GDSL hydrolase family protein n=1 Tax=Actinomadura terrae TaxID=604353 RepID=UPI001FA79945|nr:SGNH/GDSL hydrolase family protein [Actinomadura terrae]
MRPSRRAVAAAPIAAALTIGTVIGVPAASAAGPVYLALGDSSAAGLGAQDYDPASGACQRSRNAYPALWARAHPAARFVFRACSSATTADVMRTQLGDLSARTRLVSVTAGISDPDMADVSMVCAFQDDRSCEARTARARAFIDRRLPRHLDALYRAIRSKARTARVVVLGYPRSFTGGRACPAGMTPAKQAAMNRVVDEVNAVTAGRAAAHRFAFDDVQRAFTPHGVCSADTWINPPKLPLIESYLPNAAGHRLGYLPALSAAARP